jgi:hypothetical protein
MKEHRLSSGVKFLRLFKPDSSSSFTFKLFHEISASSSLLEVLPAMGVVGLLPTGVTGVTGLLPDEDGFFLFEVSSPRLSASRRRFSA